jgi:hypothetical protein
MWHITKNTHMKQISIFMLLFGLAISACSPQVEPTPTQFSAFVARELPSPTFTPLPSATFTPTSTPEPTATPTVTPTLTPTPTPDPGPELFVIGRSIQEKPIEVMRFGYGSNAIVFIGGLHAGFAPATVEIAERTIEYFTENLTAIPGEVTLYVIPNANPDSQPFQGEQLGRVNANGVDLNRNWDCRWTRDALFRGDVVPGSGGVEPFSEPEIKALVQFVEEVTPIAVVFWEARYEGGFVSPGRCDRRSSVSYPLAQLYGEAAGYQVDDFEIDTGQILNGDGTNWLDSQGYRTTAVLLPDYDNVDWEQNLAGILAVVKNSWSE